MTSSSRRPRSSEAIVPTPVERLHAVPATIDLAGAEIELVSPVLPRVPSQEGASSRFAEGVYDFILLDCPPSLGLLTINALTAAEELIVPIQCEYYALEGLGQLLRNVSLVQQNINSGLRLSGIVMTMFDARGPSSPSRSSRRSSGTSATSSTASSSLGRFDCPRPRASDSRSRSTTPSRRAPRPTVSSRRRSRSGRRPTPRCRTFDEICRRRDGSDGPGRHRRRRRVGRRRRDGRDREAEHVARSSRARPAREVRSTRLQRPEPVAEPEPERIRGLEPAPPVEARLHAPRRAGPDGPRVPADNSRTRTLWEEPPANLSPRVKPPSSPAPPGRAPPAPGRRDRRELRHRHPGSARSRLPRRLSRANPRGMADIGATLDDEQRPRSGDGGCSAREAIDVQARGSGTGALRADPGRAGGGGDEHRDSSRSPRTRSPRTRSSRGAGSTTRR